MTIFMKVIWPAGYGYKFDALPTALLDPSDPLQCRKIYRPRLFPRERRACFIVGSGMGKIDT